LKNEFLWGRNIPRATSPGLNTALLRTPSMWPVIWMLSTWMAQAFVQRFYIDVMAPVLTLNLPTTTIVVQPFNIIKWQLQFNPVA